MMDTRKFRSADQDSSRHEDDKTSRRSAGPSRTPKSATSSEKVVLEDLKKKALATGMQRGTFGSAFEYIFTAVGSAVGLGNMWRFPYVAYENGGGALFAAYIIMALFCGIPLLILEISLGQYAGLNSNIIFTQITPIFQGVGWSMALASIFDLFNYRYCIVLAWCVRYALSVFYSELRWSKCGLEELGQKFTFENCFSKEQFEDCRLKDDHTFTYWNNTCTNGTEF